MEENIIENTKNMINSSKNIIVMTGAGISVSAGIPDFRTPGTGLYSQLESYNLPFPEAIFSLDYFKKKPEPFYKLAKEIYPGLHFPTYSHFFLKLLANKNKLLRIYTQNIDSLENVAGIDKNLVVAAHGNFDSATCIKNKEKVDAEEVKKAILAGEKEIKLLNKKYGGLVKPDIVFFGEALPSRFFKLINEDFAKCDLLIVMGTSLKVQPFASLIEKVNKSVPRILINREKVGIKEDDIISFLIKKMDGFNFEDDSRDYFIQNDCDDSIKEIVLELGWYQELENIINIQKKKWKKN